MPREAPRPTRTPRASPLAEELTAARLALGLTQAQAAERIGVGSRTYTRWERGDSAPRGALAARAVASFIADAARAARPTGGRSTSRQRVK